MFTADHDGIKPISRTGVHFNDPATLTRSEGDLGAERPTLLWPPALFVDAEIDGET